MNWFDVAKWPLVCVQVLACLFLAFCVLRAIEHCRTALFGQRFVYLFAAVVIAIILAINCVDLYILVQLPALVSL